MGSVGGLNYIEIYLIKTLPKVVETLTTFGKVHNI